MQTPTNKWSYWAVYFYLGTRCSIQLRHNCYWLDIQGVELLYYHALSQKVFFLYTLQYALPIAIIRPIVIVTWSPDCDDLSWCDDSALLLHFRFKVLEERTIFLLTTRLWDQTTNRISYMIKKVLKHHWAGFPVQDPMRLYFLLSEVRWWWEVPVLLV